MNYERKQKQILETIQQLREKIQIFFAEIQRLTGAYQILEELRKEEQLEEDKKTKQEEKVKEVSEKAEKILEKKLSEENP